MDVSKYQAFAGEQLPGFGKIDLLVTAFTHRSYLNEHKKTVKEHNERLEFLGGVSWSPPALVPPERTKRLDDAVRQERAYLGLRN